MPIAQQVSAVCEGEVSATDALRALMGRTSKPGIVDSGKVGNTCDMASLSISSSAPHQAFGRSAGWFMVRNQRAAIHEMTAVRC